VTHRKREELVAEIAALREQLAAAEERLAALDIPDHELEARAADARVGRWILFGMVLMTGLFFGIHACGRL
jgi:hypothetical protein